MKLQGNTVMAVPISAGRYSMNDAETVNMWISCCGLAASLEGSDI